MNTIHTDAPEVREIGSLAFPGYNGRRFKVSAFHGPMRLDSCWGGGSRDYFCFVNLSERRSIGSVPENGTPFSNDGQVMRVSELPVGVALVQHSIYCGKDAGLTIYVHQDNLSKLLPAPVDISREEKIVLCATCSFKSSYGGVKDYRFQEAKSTTGITHEEWDVAKSSLIGRGMLNKAGAITDSGRNAISGTRLESLKA